MEYNDQQWKMLTEHDIRGIILASGGDLYSAVMFATYFGAHVVYGYYYCEYSEYANCPGYLINNDPGHEPVINFDDEEEVSDE